MIFLDSSSILSEAVEENSSLIPVINRFGIKLGLGDRNISSICKSEGIDENFFLAIINTYLNEDYFPESKLQKFDIQIVIDFLKHSDSYIVHAQLYNLEKHLNAFFAMSDPANTQLELIKKLFIRFKTELRYNIEQNLIEEETPLGLLQDLKNIFIKHITGNFNENLAYAVVFTIESMQNDIEKHNRIKEKILKPMIKSLTESGIDDWQELIATSNPKQERTETLSQRELDVLRLVAQGFINKEIGDKLGISLNTVLSHRKNITAKLKIKTVSGLIFYCISHGYISADEIEL